MTGADLLKWQASLGYTQAQAAAALGVGLRTYARYTATSAPRVVELACKALAAGLS
jgi:transcriptional regulator with XRE-family HTH domain